MNIWREILRSRAFVRRGRLADPGRQWRLERLLQTIEIGEGAREAVLGLSKLGWRGGTSSGKQAREN